jgi:hypothetical protein
MIRYILFSGGFDSTYTLLKLCEEFKDDDDQICAISILAEITGPLKLRREKKSRERTINYIKAIYPTHKIENVEIHIPAIQNSKNLYCNSMGIVQPILWLCNIAPLLVNGSELYMGYIKGDDAVNMLTHIQNFWDESLIIQANKDIKLIFPLLYTEKFQVIRYFIENHPKTLEWLVSCENEGEEIDDLNCGHCTPCRHLAVALMSLLWDDDDKISKMAENILLTRFNRKFSLTIDKSDTKSLESSNTNIESYNKEGESSC